VVEEQWAVRLTRMPSRTQVKTFSACGSFHKTFSVSVGTTSERG